MNELRKKALNRMLARRKELQAEYDRLISEPLSYGVTGSVKARNRSLEELRAEISVLDDRIKSLLARIGGLAGMDICVPSYRWGNIPLWGSELYEREAEQ